MTKHQNRATIYSNGIAELQRVYPVENSHAAKISIPVRQQHLADVLASLTISGNVKIDSPPSFQPANVDEGNLEIEPGNVVVSLTNQLAGAMVTIQYRDDELEGQLVGHQEHVVGTGKDRTYEKHLVMLIGTAIKRVPLNEVAEVKFTDPVIQAEIDKALSRKIREIKPNSTFVDLQLSTESESTDAIVQYTIPAAAWKISYRLILQDDNRIELQGHAIVDNNTDEDWKEFIVSVVMGQPITFTSDLADSKTPNRGHIDIVQESAIGAIEVEDELMLRPEERLLQAIDVESAPMPRAGRKVRMASAASMIASPAPESRAESSAEFDQASVSDAGDFCIFESAYPVSIDARRSAVIPVFQTDMEESDTVLHYKFGNNHHHPYRAVRFKNGLEHALGRGICTVIDNTTYAGSCVIPGLKPGDETLLAHALETSVKVTRLAKSVDSKRVGVKISDGVVVESVHQETEIEYQIRSRGSKALPFVLDHQSNLLECESEVQLIRPGTDPELVQPKRTPSGCRVEFDIAEDDGLIVLIKEKRVRESHVRLTGTDDTRIRVNWLYTNRLDANSPLLKDPAVNRCIDLHQEVEKVEKQFEAARSEIDRLTQRQERLRKNIKTGGGEKQNQRWQSDLGKAEDSIVELEETRLPELEAKASELRASLHDSLKGIVMEWTE